MITRRKRRSKKKSSQQPTYISRRAFFCSYIFFPSSLAFFSGFVLRKIRISSEMASCALSASRRPVLLFAFHFSYFRLLFFVFCFLFRVFFTLSDPDSDFDSTRFSATFDSFFRPIFFLAFYFLSPFLHRLFFPFSSSLFVHILRYRYSYLFAKSLKHGVLVHYEYNTHKPQTERKRRKIKPNLAGLKASGLSPNIRVNFTVPHTLGGTAQR